MAPNIDITRKCLTKDGKLRALELEHAQAKQKEARLERCHFFTALLVAIPASWGLTNVNTEILNMFHKPTDTFTVFEWWVFVTLSIAFGLLGAYAGYLNAVAKVRAPASQIAHQIYRRKLELGLITPRDDDRFEFVRTKLECLDKQIKEMKEMKVQLKCVELLLLTRSEFGRDMAKQTDV